MRSFRDETCMKQLNKVLNRSNRVNDAKILVLMHQFSPKSVNIGINYE